MTRHRYIDREGWIDCPARAYDKAGKPSGRGVELLLLRGSERNEFRGWRRLGLCRRGRGCFRFSEELSLGRWGCQSRCEQLNLGLGCCSGLCDRLSGSEDFGVDYRLEHRLCIVLGTVDRNWWWAGGIGCCDRHWTRCPWLSVGS